MCQVSGQLLQKHTPDSLESHKQVKPGWSSEEDVAFVRDFTDPDRIHDEGKE